METQSCIENPTLSARKFKLGDFVYWLMDDTHSSVGVVSKVHGKNIRIRHYEDGFSSEVSRIPECGSVRKVSKSEAVEHFLDISDRFRQETDKVGGLSGAVSARKRHYMSDILREVTRKNGGALLDPMFEPQEPMTGVYVLAGIYAGHGLSRHLQGLTADPRLSEGLISRLFIDMYPKGFGRIPEYVYNTPVASQGFLVAYKTYEVPKDERGLVDRLKRLELHLD